MRAKDEVNRKEYVVTETDDFEELRRLVIMACSLAEETRSISRFSCCVVCVLMICAGLFVFLSMIL